MLLGFIIFVSRHGHRQVKGWSNEASATPPPKLELSEKYSKFTKLRNMPKNNVNLIQMKSTIFWEKTVVC
jgi:hypothetical protein